ncbi:MAG: 6-hydroxymethylpterin diphosphokinase MptE-like protein [Promethearchaeati archaeon]
MNKKILDRYEDFKTIYERILRDFQFNREMDRKARDILLNIFKEKNVEWTVEKILANFRTDIQNYSNILIYGCGPSLEETVNRLFDNRKKSYFANLVHLAADGASVLLKEMNIPIHGLFTDLDGITKAEFEYAKFVIVHGHGDNIDKVKQFEKEIIKKENVIGTTQVKPKGPILNPGGFTDGDRILYFIRNLILSNQKIFFIGMDFNKIVGKYSKPEFIRNRKANEIKRKKLIYAKKLIEELVDQMDNDVYFVNSLSNSDSKQFKYISFKEFENKLV